jgi:IK cytokine
VDEQRKYLGGDAKHSVLVKGLDFSLLEQTKAQAAATHDAEDEDELERAFELAKHGPVIDADTSKSTAPKRSRADLLKDLKATRGASGETVVEKVIDVKETGKFKPIGFKPIGGTETNTTTKKKKKVKEVGPEGERTKKRRKVDSEPTVNATVAQPAPATSTSAPTSETLASVPAPALPKASIVEPISTPEEDDFDIFAGVGDYEGVDLGDSSGEEDSTKPTQAPDETTGSSSLPLPGRRGWFDDPEPENEPEAIPEPASSVTLISHAPQTVSSDVENEDDQPSRLMPLMASAVPSIKDMLAADEELAKEEKRRARKEKRKRAAA